MPRVKANRGKASAPAHAPYLRPVDKNGRKTDDCMDAEGRATQEAKAESTRST